jgi:hypothetical protein
MKVFLLSFTFLLVLVSTLQASDSTGALPGDQSPRSVCDFLLLPQREEDFNKLLNESLKSNHPATANAAFQLIKMYGELTIQEGENLPQVVQEILRIIISFENYTLLTESDFYQSDPETVKGYLLQMRELATVNTESLADLTLKHSRQGGLDVISVKIQVAITQDLIAEQMRDQALKDFEARLEKAKNHYKPSSLLLTKEDIAREQKELVESLQSEIDKLTEKKYH